jgi:hypothetical protein
VPRLMTIVSPANPAATETPPTRTNSSRPPLLHDAARAPHAASPNQGSMQYGKCGKVVAEARHLR